MNPRDASRRRDLLGRDPAEIASALVADTEEMRDLRPCSPFAGVVSPDERRRIIREVHEDGERAAAAR